LNGVVLQVSWAEMAIDDIVGGPVIDAALPAATGRMTPTIW